MGRTDRVGSLVTTYSRVVIAVFLLFTMVVGVGAGSLEQSTSVEVGNMDSTALPANEYVQENFTAREANTTTAVVAVRNPNGTVLSKDALLRTLEYQRAIRTNETLNATLAETRPTVGIGNVVARTAIAMDYRGSPQTDNASATAGSARDRAPPSIDAQIDALESLSETEVRLILGQLLAADSDMPGSETARRLLPRDYEPGTTTADARLVLVTQETEQPLVTGGELSAEVRHGEVVTREIAHQQSGPEQYVAVGQGLLASQEHDAIGDTMSVLGPIALLFVLLALSLAYRDVLDVALGLVGIAMVLVLTFGTMGWAGITYTQILVAVPILLIGLSVDYCFHVVMRYREERHRDGVDARTGMARSVSGVAPALALVTVTTAIGFLSNLTSSLPTLGDFGLATAIGIVASLLVFGLFVPAVKSELDAGLEARGRDRTSRQFGGGGAFASLLGGAATAARRGPLLVLAIALILSAAGAAGATQVESSYSPDQFIAEEPAAWTQHLPADQQPSEYFIRDNREYVYSQFQSPDKQGHVLIQGNVTEPGTLDRVATAEDSARDANVTFVRPNGEKAVETPLSGMARTADRNASFNATFQAADTDGDGVPDRNLATVYDAYYAAAPDRAARTIHRTDDGEYVALRLRIALSGNAERSAVAAQLGAAAADVESGDESLTATATGRPVVAREIAETLTTTVIESLALTLVAILALLAVVFRVREGSATLGALTLVPVVLTLTWLLGTMALLDIPITMTTAVIGGISLGLGVDYAIHISERFADELGSGLGPATALERTVVGTGGALLSSAITTAAGFGVLAFAMLPALADFGFVLAVVIVYAFAASVLLQPTLLYLWAQYGGTPVAQPRSEPLSADD